MKGQPMLHSMQTLEAAGKAFGTKKLQDLSDLGKPASTHQKCNQSHSFCFRQHCIDVVVYNVQHKHMAYPYLTLCQRMISLNGCNTFYVEF